ncbi:MAG: response regulator transcription factor [bacterium]
MKNYETTSVTTTAKENSNKKKKILWLDNEPYRQSINRMFLESQGYEVVFVSNGLKALESTRKNIPDLILLDLMIQGISSYQICGILKRDNRFWQIPIIMISARTGEDDLMLAKTNGADAYITKPFEIQTLLSRVSLLINGKKAWEKPTSSQAGLVGAQWKF